MVIIIQGQGNPGGRVEQQFWGGLNNVRRCYTLNYRTTLSWQWQLTMQMGKELEAKKRRASNTMIGDLRIPFELKYE